MGSDPDTAGDVQMRIRAASDQFAAAVTDAVLTARRVSVAQQLMSERGNAGPWLLYADGRVEDTT
jgi:hypothetical protein